MNNVLAWYVAYGLLAVAFVAFGILTVGCYGDRSHSPSVSALIQDANHLDGNAFFVWLPPLLQQQAPAEQVFSQQLQPTVTISNLCSGAVIRTWSGSDVQVSDAKYHVVSSGLFLMGQSTVSSNYSTMFAAYVLASIPLLILFLYATKPFMAGVTSGAFKA